MTTYAQSLNGALGEAMDEDRRVFVLGEDICDPYGGAFKITKGLCRKHPDRVRNTPISEASITGIAAGMAIRGWRPVVEIMFGDFLALAADQILSNISKLRWTYNDRIRMPLVIRTPMGGRRGYGPTHSQSIEKLFMGVPGITIVAPSCFHDPGALLKNSIRDDDPVLFIEYKLDYPRVLRSTETPQGISRVTAGEGYPTLRFSSTDFEDDDVTIMTYGGMAPYVEEAMKRLLYEDDIAAEIVIPSLIKPVETDALFDSVKKTGRVVVVEEGTMTNGWGAEVAALVSDRAFGMLTAPVKRVAAKDYPIANTKPLEDHILPDADDIIKAVKEVV